MEREWAAKYVVVDVRACTSVLLLVEVGALTTLLQDFPRIWHSTLTSVADV